MLDEVLYSERESGCKISNIVLMGIGEPLDNFDNVMRFLELVNHPDGENIGMRHISLSTCGLIERFDDLAAARPALTLSVSLHAPDDETRLEDHAGQPRPRRSGAHRRLAPDIIRRPDGAFPSNTR